MWSDSAFFLTRGSSSQDLPNLTFLAMMTFLVRRPHMFEIHMELRCCFLFLGNMNTCSTPIDSKSRLLRNGLNPKLASSWFIQSSRSMNHVTAHHVIMTLRMFSSHSSIELRSLVRNFFQTCILRMKVTFNSELNKLLLGIGTSHRSISSAGNSSWSIRNEAFLQSLHVPGFRMSRTVHITWPIEALRGDIYDCFCRQNVPICINHGSRGNLCVILEQWLEFSHVGGGTWVKDLFSSAVLAITLNTWCIAALGPVKLSVHLL